MLTCRPHFGALQHIAQAWPAETCGPNRALLPLHSWHMRNGERPAVPGTFQSVDDGVLLNDKEIFLAAARRYLLGRQGLWAGRISETIRLNCR